MRYAKRLKVKKDEHGNQDKTKLNSYFNFL